MRDSTKNRHPKLGARLSYQRESLRRKMSIRRLALGVLVNLLIVILLGSWVLMRFERNQNPKVNTYGDAVWLSVVTISTVGYGDSYPVTTSFCPRICTTSSSLAWGRYWTPTLSPGFCWRDRPAITASSEW